MADLAGVKLKIVQTETSISAKSTTFLLHPDAPEEPITSTAAIAVLLCKLGNDFGKRLIGSDKSMEEVAVEGWLAWFDLNWHRVATNAEKAITSPPNATQPQGQHCIFQIKHILLPEIERKLADQLSPLPSITLNRLTLADIYISLHLSFLFQSLIGQQFQKTIPTVSSWFQRIMSLPAVVSRSGYVKIGKVPVALGAPRPFSVE